MPNVWMCPLAECLDPSATGIHISLEFYNKKTSIFRLQSQWCQRSVKNTILAHCIARCCLLAVAQFALQQLL